jgi:hypothetical protein
MQPFSRQESFYNRFGTEFHVAIYSLWTQLWPEENEERPKRTAAELFSSWRDDELWNLL